METNALAMLMSEVDLERPDEVILKATVRMPDGSLKAAAAILSKSNLSTTPFPDVVLGNYLIEMGRALMQLPTQTGGYE